MRLFCSSDRSGKCRVQWAKRRYDRPLPHTKATIHDSTHLLLALATSFYKEVRNILDRYARKIRYDLSALQRQPRSPVAALELEP